jgi:hypothetical protein
MNKKDKEEYKREEGTEKRKKLEKKGENRKEKKEQKREEGMEKRREDIREKKE